MADGSKSVLPDPDTRGAGTRAQLILAAMQLFSAHGFDGVSTRTISAAAGANQAAINYHFGGKSGLYRAVITHITEEVRRRMGPVAEASVSLLAAEPGNRRNIAEAVRQMLTGLMTAFIADHTWRPAFGLVTREYTHPSDAFPILYENAIGPMHQAMTALVSAARGRVPEHADSIIEAHAIIGQCLAFGIARIVLCKRLGQDDYDPDSISRMIDNVVAMTLGALGLPDPDQGAADG